ALAQQYAFYLATLAEADEADETSERIRDVLERFGGHTPHWVQAWLTKPLLAPHAQLNEGATQWLRGILQADTPYLLRARAALALACHNRIDLAEISAFFN